MTHNLNDQKLFELFRDYGAKALLYRQKCIGMLPEINKRRLHLQHGCASIFEFAAKFAGLSHEQVKRVLSLNDHFYNKPALKQALESGEVSVNKLARIAAVASTENQEMLAAASRTLSKNALDTLARDIRQLDKKVAPSDFVPGHKVELAPPVQERLYALQQRGIDVNLLISEMLDRREREISEKKMVMAFERPRAGSRHVPVAVKRLVMAEYGRGCSVPGCARPAVALHHAARFALTRNHDPRFLAPMCAGHHELAHGLDLRYRQAKAAAGGRGPNAAEVPCGQAGAPRCRGDDQRPGGGRGAAGELRRATAQGAVLMVTMALFFCRIGAI